MPDVGTTRKRLSDLVKGYSKFEGDAGIGYHFARVDVEGSGDVDNIGIPLMWSVSDGAFVEFVINPDWLASTETALGATVKPTTQNDYEYVCITAGTTNDTEGEPTWPTTEGATVTETDGVVWICRAAYSGSESPLPDGANICVTVGAKEGKGVNETDTTLSATAVEMHVIYRGIAAVVEDGFEWGSIATVDQDEFYTQLEKQGIAVIESGTTVDPVYV